MLSQNLESKPKKKLVLKDSSNHSPSLPLSKNTLLALHFWRGYMTLNAIYSSFSPGFFHIKKIMITYWSIENKIGKDIEGTRERIH
jgi:hypothetical protein